MTERRDMPEPALHIAAAILQRDFSETFGVETIEAAQCSGEIAIALRGVQLKDFHGRIFGIGDFFAVAIRLFAIELQFDGGARFGDGRVGGEDPAL